MTLSSTRRAKILLLIPHLGGGGAEGITATLARFLNSQTYEVHLGVVTRSDHRCEDIPRGNALHLLGARRVRFGAWRLLRLVWRVRPSLILSGMAHLNLLALMLRPIFPAGTRVLVRQNGALPATLATGGNPRLARRLYGIAYRRADKVICQTHQMAEELETELGVEKARLVVLRNPVDVQGIREVLTQGRSFEKSPRPRLLAVARLAPEKGIDLLLKAFAAIRLRFPSAELDIAGAGPREHTLKTQCDMLGIEGYVKFLGNVDAPAALFRSATAFVLSSRHEGMPNAMLEAAAAGLPIVALPASAGLTQLLLGKPGIWLAREVSAKALENALCDALSYLHPGQRFEHEWIRAFDLKNAIHAYEKVLDQALLEQIS